MVLALDSIGRDLLGSQIEWVENCMEEDIKAWARAAKSASPREMRGPTQSARTRAKCVGRGSIARAALSARAAIAWRGE